MGNEYIIKPGDTILELLEVNSMSRLDLACKSGVSIGYINDIIEGNVPISMEIGLKLECVFNISYEFWINLERNYRSSLEK